MTTSHANDTEHNTDGKENGRRNCNLQDRKQVTQADRSILQEIEEYYRTELERMREESGKGDEIRRVEVKGREEMG